MMKSFPRLILYPCKVLFLMLLAFNHMGTACAACSTRTAIPFEEPGDNLFRISGRSAGSQPIMEQIYLN